MKKHTLTALVLSGALAFSLTSGAMAASAFTDLSGLKSWGLEAVDYVTSNGLMNGTSTTTFTPNGYADRSTVATLIWRMAGEPIGNITGTFSDVPLGQWYSDAIDWAAEAGVITGASGKFRPFEIVTRQDLAVMLYRYAGSPPADVTVLSFYQDYNEVSSYAANAMAWAVSEGILSGDGSRLMPQNGTTRVQLAAILMRYLERDAQPEDNDVLPPETSQPGDNTSASAGSDNKEGSGTGSASDGAVSDDAQAGPAGTETETPSEGGSQDTPNEEDAPSAGDGQDADPQPGVETLSLS